MQLHIVIVPIKIPQSGFRGPKETKRYAEAIIERGSIKDAQKIPRVVLWFKNLFNKSEKESTIPQRTKGIIENSSLPRIIEKPPTIAPKKAW